MTRKKKTSPNPSYADLKQAALEVCEIFPHQPVPLEDLCIAIAKLQYVATRDPGRPGVDSDTIDLIRSLKADGKTIPEIAAAAQVAKSTVIKYTTGSKTKGDRRRSR